MLERLLEMAAFSIAELVAFLNLAVKSSVPSGREFLDEELWCAGGGPDWELPFESSPADLDLELAAVDKLFPSKREAFSSLKRSSRKALRRLNGKPAKSGDKNWEGILPRMELADWFLAFFAKRVEASDDRTELVAAFDTGE